METPAVVVNVDTPSGSYNINIGEGRLEHLADTIPENTSAIALITNSTIAQIYGSHALGVLRGTGKPVIQITLPDGETHKNWKTLNSIYDELLTNRFDRNCVMVALGGGVIGDMVGFAAATYMRGVRFVQVPTTLLAQVDSSVGGKTAINHPIGKNMIGAFYQPIAVEIDTSVLGTLPSREVSAGLAEVIKYGMIIDADFFSWCEENMHSLMALDNDAVRYAIQRSCELKAHVVSLDEREAGLRAILNFGHTFGHAIEAALGYGQWLHGEAVGCGMIQAAELSRLVTHLEPQEVSRIKSLVHASGCPTQAPDLGSDRWISLMQGDKKALAGAMRFVLLNKIGEAVVHKVDADTVRKVLPA